MKLQKYTILISQSIFLITFVYTQIIYADTGMTDVFDEGAIAFTRGDYETAVKKFIETAGKGDYRAMYALGSMYSEGIGVEQEHKRA